MPMILLDNSRAMNNTEIKKYFAVDTASGEHLKEQMRKRVEGFINTHEAGTRLPSGRDMVEALDISRITVRNAMQSFFDSGAIISRGRHGVFIAEKSRSSILKDIHPMAMGGGVSVSKIQTLKLLLYENIPFQKAFWEEIIRRFNKHSQSFRVQIEWLPQTVNQNDFEEYLRNCHVDLFQHAVNHNSEKSAQKLPDELINMINQPEYRHEVFPPEMKPLFKHMLPVHFNLNFIYWNADLAKAVGLNDIRQRIRRNELSALLAEATAKLPDGKTACGHIWDRLAFMGQPANLEDINEEYFIRQLSRIFQYDNAGATYIYRQQYPMEAVENFHAGKQLFLDSIPTHAYVFGNNTNFELSCEPCPLLDGNRQYTAAMGLGISRNSSNYHGGVEFIRFMLSEEAQEFLASAKSCPPVLRGAAGRIPQTSPQLETLLQRYRIYDPYSQSQECLFMNYLTYHTRNILQQLCEKSISIEDAASTMFKNWSAQIDEATAGF